MRGSARVAAVARMTAGIEPFGDSFGQSNRDYQTTDADYVPNQPLENRRQKCERNKEQS